MLASRTGMIKLHHKTRAEWLSVMDWGNHHLGATRMHDEGTGQATLHPAGPGAHALAAAFGHSVQAALAVNIGLIAAALVLAVFGPRRDAAAPGTDAAGSASSPVHAARA